MTHVRLQACQTVLHLGVFVQMHCLMCVNTAAHAIVLPLHIAFIRQCLVQPYFRQVHVLVWVECSFTSCSAGIILRTTPSSTVNPCSGGSLQSQQLLQESSAPCLPVKQQMHNSLATADYHCRRPTRQNVTVLLGIQRGVQQIYCVGSSQGTQLLQESSAPCLALKQQMHNSLATADYLCKKLPWQDVAKLLRFQRVCSRCEVGSQ